MQEDRQRVVSAYLRVTRLVTFLAVPAMVGLAVLADLAIRIGFGPDWSAAVDPLRVVSIAAAVTSMAVVAAPIFGAMGRPGVLVLTSLVTLVALCAGLLLTLPDPTLTFVAMAVLCASVIELVTVLGRLRSFIGLRVGEFIRSTAPFIVVALLMAGLVILLRQLVLDQLPIIATALLGVVAGASVYLGVGLLAFRTAFRQQLTAVRDIAVPGRRITRELAMEAGNGPPPDSPHL
jgi:PST family polysaccharide transporter